MLKFGSLIIFFVQFTGLITANAAGVLPEENSYFPDENSQAFRNQVIEFVRAVATNELSNSTKESIQKLESKWYNKYQDENWTVTIALFHKGNRIGRSNEQGKSLTDVLKKATEKCLAQVDDIELTKRNIDAYRFQVDFDYFPSQRLSIIEYNGKGLRLLGNRVAIWNLTAQSLQNQIELSQDYLLRMKSPQWDGFFKFYDAEKDEQETLLRTIYSASTLYTFLKLYSWNSDPVLLENFELIASFILSNQVPTGPHAGGFYYGFEPETNEKVCRVVVGTTSKTIFTLLELHKFYPNEEVYLASAIKAGDWLLKMVKLDGGVTPIADCSTGEWQYDDRQSLLYSGQVLSALSRLYAQTGQMLYYDGAKKIADNFVSLVEQRGPLLGDQYRPPNSISSSWVLMSLVDFAKVEQNQVYRNALLEVADTLLSRQIRNSSDVYNHGRYLDAMTTSGNGWLNEVMGELYNFCMDEEDAEDCQKYYKAMVLSSRWLLQNSYTAENTYNVKNPTRAIGGFITNLNSPTVRTDAVCHGVNSLLTTLLAAGQTKEALVALHERPIQEIIPLLRAGVSPLTFNPRFRS